MKNITESRVHEFDDETILKMFGAHAAEDETFEKLKGYFVRNKAYDRLRANIKLRLLGSVDILDCDRSRTLNSSFANGGLNGQRSFCDFG